MENVFMERISRVFTGWRFAILVLLVMMMVVPVMAGSPVAGFSADPTSGAAPLAVQFTDASSNTPTEWSWDFGENTGSVYVADSGSAVVKRVYPNGTIAIIGSGIVTPYGIAVDSAGNAYVADMSAASVHKIYPNGTTVVLKDGFSSPNGVTVDSAGNVYVASSGSVSRISPDGTTVTLGSGFSTPSDVAVDSTGNVYVADNGNNAVYEIFTDGTMVTRKDGLSYAWSVAVDFQGNVYATDPGAGVIYKISPDGTTVTLGDGHFSQPIGIEVDSQGNVYVSDYDRYELYEIYPDGTVVTLGAGFINAMSVAVKPADSLVQSPAYTYATPGTYTVTLTAANADGKDTEAKTDYITVTAGSAAPVAAFSATPTTGTAPLAVQFSDTSANAPTSWAWDFGDGSTSTAQSPLHIYLSGGTFTVTLTATNAMGSDSEVKTGYVTVTVKSGLADSAWPKFGYDSRNSGHSPYRGSQTGTPKWEQQATNGFDNYVDQNPAIGPDGTFYVADYYGFLYAINPDGTTKWTSTKTSMGWGGATGSVTLGPDGTLYIGTDDDYTYAVFSSNGTIKWKASSPCYSIGSPAIGSDGTIYVGDLCAFNPDGSLKWKSDTGSRPYVSPAIGPDGTIYTTRGSGTLGYGLVAFNPDGSSKWFYSTGSSSPVDTTSPVVSQDGSTVYIADPNGVVYAVNSSYGTKDWLYDSGILDSATGLLATGSDGTIYFGGGVSSHASVIALTPEGTLKWNADYLKGARVVHGAIGGDGTLYVLDQDWSAAYAINPDDGSQIWYYETADWTEHMGGQPAISSDGTVYARTETGKIYAFPGVVDYTADKTLGSTPLAVQFTGSSPLTVTSWHWDFGDGITSTEQSPAHIYTADGTYTVTLNITHADGTNYLRKTDYISVGTIAPVASFTANVTSGPFPLAVEFTDTSENDPASWAWDFDNDGTVDATTQNATHTYTTAGMYTVSLTATNAAGSNTATKTDYIEARTPVIPVASFSAMSRSGLAPLTVRFTDSSQYEPASWLWDFGDGSTSTDQNPEHTYTTAGSYTVSLTATNGDGSGTVSVPDYVAVLEQQPLSSYRFINVHVANDEGVKYDVPNGAAASGGTYTYVNNTYWVMFRQSGGGLNPMHISASSNANSAAEITRTTEQSGSFWITFSGGQPTMPDAVLMLAVNGTVPDDFRVHIRSSGQDFDVGSPGTSNQGLPSTSTFLDGAVDQDFTKEDFIYGLQSWKPCSSADYPIYGGEDQSDPTNQYNLMFIDLKVGAIQNSALPENGMIKVEYSFENLESWAVFNTYGWYMTCNHGTGIIMTNNVDLSGYTVVGTAPAIAPVAEFTSDVTTGPAPLTVVFTDQSANTPTSWAWDFGDGDATNATVQSPVHTYAAAGTYTVKLTATNAAGSDDEENAGYITVTTGILPLPGYTNLPTDPDSDGIYEDLNANGRLDFADVVLYFNEMEWIAENEPVAAFDLNGNVRIDFADIVELFNEI